ncbi:MAG: cyclopropane-fatty-acyl-phospholipid synthase family protein [Gemmatimonadota bacterium]|nr:cyclopropane-fatty-acyl-phospholipid synthase family protein [Gemmatimonadota bacterium]
MKTLFHELFSEVRGDKFTVTYPDGSREEYGDGEVSQFNLIFKTEKAMRAIMVNVDLGFGEAYMVGDIDVEGSLIDVMNMVMTNDMIGAFRKVIYGPANMLRHLPSQLKVFWQYLYQRHTYKNDKRYISEPYDLGNEFYALWLDKDMQYTCGYFKTPNDSIDLAQDQKREHVCRKLRLEPGESLLDIGCGWGGMLIYAAKHYGINGVGVTLSKEQAEESNRRIKQAGLQDQIHVEHLDYRDLPKQGRVFDKVVSVGCLEHIGKENHDLFFSIAKQSLKPGGTFVLHTIGKMKPGPSLAFGNKHVFPGVYTVSLAQIGHCVEKLGMRIHDVENLRLHYSYTTHRWLDAFEEHVDKIRDMYDDQLVRLFRLYLSHGVALMRYGKNELYQVVITPGIDNERPLTRDFLYAEERPVAVGAS